jgi:hypothetical protein
MRVNSLIIDDFYTNPEEVREFALQQEFSVRGNYPGRRTISYLNDSLKESISKIIEPHAGTILSWGGDYTGCFQYTTAEDRSWIHADSYTDWAGVLYLTPDAPISAGTGLFRHKETGLRNWNYRERSKEEDTISPHMQHPHDYTKWDMTDKFGNFFNRLILYRADLYHVSLDYFGTSKEDGRLFQVFFFNTEY